MRAAVIEGVEFASLGMEDRDGYRSSHCGRHQQSFSLWDVICGADQEWVSRRHTGVPRCSSVVSDGAPENGVFHFRDSFGDLNATRARLGAVEDGATAPYTLFVIEDL